MDKALWQFYIDSIPNGQLLIRHPVDRNELMIGPKAYYPPMRKIFCDRRVISSMTGQHFYRVQGTKGWIVDRGLSSSARRIPSGKAISMLLPESHVRTGVFAFRCRRRIAVRMQAADEFAVPTLIEKGHIVVADFVREPLHYSSRGSNSSSSSSSVNDEDFDKENSMDRSDGSNITVHGDHPHLRLVDGSGWLFKSKSGRQFLEEVPVELGSWKLQCVSRTPVGLRRQPIDRNDMSYPCNMVKYKNTVNCDARIEDTESGRTYYRVKETNGFIFDLSQNGEAIFRVLEDSAGGDAAVARNRSGSSQSKWTPDFVRGIASLVDGVMEIEHDGMAKMLSFSSPESHESKVNVYYGTKIVGTASLNDASLGNTQFFRRDCTPSDVADILKARLVAKKEKETPPVMTIFAPTYDMKAGLWGAEEEQILRQELIDCYADSEILKQKQLALLRMLKSCDDKRSLSERRLLEIKAKRKEEERRKGDAGPPKTIEQKPRKCLCEDCGLAFMDVREKQSHWLTAHGHKCEDCGVFFASVQEMAAHQSKVHPIKDDNELEVNKSSYALDV